MKRSPLRRKIHADERGNALIELAFAAPILVLLIFGGVEMSRFMMSYQKLSRVAMSTADLSSQGQTITESELANVFAAAEQVAGTSDFPTRGRLILTSVFRPTSGVPTVQWQREYGASITAAVSKVGVEGGTAALPPSIVLVDGDSVIIAEAFYEFEVLFFHGLIDEDNLIYQTAFYRPRFGALREVSPDPIT